MTDATPPPDRYSVLFVCLGNICRSPLAEGIFLDLVRKAGVEDRFVVESAGTGSWHVGERPDSRATLVAERYGVALESRARQVSAEDLSRFDWIIAMDRENLQELERLAAETGSTARLRLLREFDPDADGDEVPDPYYGGASGFENVYDMIRRASRGLLDRILANR